VVFILHIYSYQKRQPLVELWDPMVVNAAPLVPSHSLLRYQFIIIGIIIILVLLL